MTYQLIIPKAVEKQLNKLPHQIGETVIENLLILKDNPRPPNSKKLKNTQGYRLRVGNYRILYDIDDLTQTITLRRVGHRRDIYR